jgi:tetratricopeptide (TPR) repeat protein
MLKIEVVRTRYAMCVVALLLPSAAPIAQRGGAPQSELVRQGQQLTRDNKLDEALASYQRELQASPDSVAANTGAGIVFDLLGSSADAKRYFTKAIDAASTPLAKANARRAMAMSYAFDNDCRNTARLEEQVFDYYVSVNDFYNQGEILNEAARVCIEAGDFDAAETLYKRGRDAGLQEPGIAPDRVALWKFRTEHALARLAARRHQPAAAQQHVAAAKAILDANPEMAKAQAVFLPYLTGYVAFYGGAYQTALTDLQQANQSDPFIQVLLGETYEKLGDAAHARDCYQRAATTTAHNPPAAFARPFASKKLAR